MKRTSTLKLISTIAIIGLGAISSHAQAVHIGAEVFPYSYKIVHKAPIVINGFFGPTIRVVDIYTATGSDLVLRYHVGHEFYQTNVLGLGGELGLIGRPFSGNSSEALTGVDVMGLARYSVTDEFHIFAKAGIVYNDFTYKVKSSYADQNRSVSFSSSSPEVRVGAEYRPTISLGISASVNKAFNENRIDTTYANAEVKNKAYGRIGVNWYFN